jgi:hypothetical protein
VSSRAKDGQVLPQPHGYGKASITALSHDSDDLSDTLSTDEDDDPYRDYNGLVYTDDHDGFGYRDYVADNDNGYSLRLLRSSGLKLTNSLNRYRYAIDVQDYQQTLDTCSQCLRFCSRHRTSDRERADYHMLPVKKELCISF